MKLGVIEFYIVASVFDFLKTTKPSDIVSLGTFVLSAVFIKNDF